MQTTPRQRTRPDIPREDSELFHGQTRKETCGCLVAKLWDIVRRRREEGEGEVEGRERGREGERGVGGWRMNRG